MAPNAPFDEFALANRITPGLNSLDTIHGKPMTVPFYLETGVLKCNHGSSY